MSVLSVFIFMLMCVSGNITVTDYTRHTDFQLFPFSEYPEHVQPSGSINYETIASFGQKFTFSPLNDLCDLTDRLYSRHCKDFWCIYENCISFSRPKPYIIHIQMPPLEFILPFMP